MKDLCHITLSEPPEILFYASDIGLCDKVFKQGLKRKTDTFIELFETRDEALQSVGRFRTPSLFAIIAHVMVDDGYKFYHAETGEWLADEVPPRYVRFQ